MPLRSDDPRNPDYRKKRAPNRTSVRYYGGGRDTTGDTALATTEQPTIKQGADVFGRAYRGELRNIQQEQRETRDTIEEAFGYIRSNDYDRKPQSGLLASTFANVDTEAESAIEDFRINDPDVRRARALAYRGTRAFSGRATARIMAKTRAEQAQARQVKQQIVLDFHKQLEQKERQLSEERLRAAGKYYEFTVNEEERRKETMREVLEGDLLAADFDMDTFDKEYIKEMADEMNLNVNVVAAELDRIRNTKLNALRESASELGASQEQINTAQTYSELMGLIGTLEEERFKASRTKTFHQTRRGTYSYDPLTGETKLLVSEPLPPTQVSGTGGSGRYGGGAAGGVLDRLVNKTYITEDQGDDLFAGIVAEEVLSNEYMEVAKLFEGLGVGSLEQDLRILDGIGGDTILYAWNLDEGTTDEKKGSDAGTFLNIAEHALTDKTNVRGNYGEVNLEDLFERWSAAIVSKTSLELDRASHKESLRRSKQGERYSDVAQEMATQQQKYLEGEGRVVNLGLRQEVAKIITLAAAKIRTDEELQATNVGGTLQKELPERATIDRVKTGFKNSHFLRQLPRQQMQDTFGTVLEVLGVDIQRYNDDINEFVI